jgi:hypothetical protein
MKTRSLISSSILFISLSFLAASFSFGQSYLTIGGSVQDEETKKPLSFASVSISGESIGTVTNVNGEFDFHIPEQYLHDTLVISHVGYKSLKRCVADIQNKHAFELKPYAFLLNEVEIREKNLTGKEIVSKAIKNLTLNYSTKPYCLEGFFREIEEENNKYVLLTEAAVDVYDKSFDGKRKSQLQESVDVKEMRRSLRHSGLKNRNNIGIALTDLIENNDVRYNRGMMDTSTNEFSIDTITAYNDRMVYGISVSNKIDKGMLYIDIETYGVLKISMERKNRDGGKYYYINPGPNRMSRGRVWFVFSVEFELYNGKLYPRRMHESELNELYDPKTSEVKITSIETLEFVANNIHPGKESKEAKKLKYGLIIKHKEYNKEFWANYNTLKLTPLSEKLIRNLEKEISLQEQFEQR